MGREIVTSITINAPPETVYQILLDLPKHKDWNPFLVSIEGKPEVGETLNVAFFNGFKMSPKVVVVDTNKQFKWQGKLACGGLFDGEHRFVLKPLDGGSKTELEHGEQFSGILIPFMSSLLKDTEQNFQKMNNALKQRCEAQE